MNLIPRYDDDDWQRRKRAERIDKISVYGGLDQLLNGLAIIRPPA